MHETLQLISAGPRRQASAKTSAESFEACQRKMKDRADGMREKVPISPDRIRSCTSGIRAHRAADYTTRVSPPRVSRSKHFRDSPVSSTAKQSCMKHSNSYLRNRDVKHLQGPPLSRTKRVRETVCVCKSLWQNLDPQSTTHSHLPSGLNLSWSYTVKQTISFSTSWRVNSI